MHASHQLKIINAGFTIYRGMKVDNSFFIKVKTKSNHNWHNLEKDFPSAAALKRRLHELDKKPMWIDLNDTKNTI